ncbi:hypothetical protein A2U01_0004233, partial [Trifolium medium]|nr:hypothetical protein [Trifolium medium]
YIIFLILPLTHTHSIFSSAFHHQPCFNHKINLGFPKIKKSRKDLPHCHSFPEMNLGFAKILQEKKKAPKIWGRASYGRVLHLCSKRAQSHKWRVQQRIAANLEEEIAFEELAKGLEPLLEVEVSSKYKTNEEIVERRRRRKDDLQKKYPTNASDAQEGIEEKFNTTMLLWIF